MPKSLGQERNSEISSGIKKCEIGRDNKILVVAAVDGVVEGITYTIAVDYANDSDDTNFPQTFAHLTSA